MDEQAVWKRVCPPQSPPQDLTALEAAARELAGIYRSLSTALTGPAGPLAKGLHREAENAALLIRGIRTLSGDAGLVPQPLPQGKNTVRATLRKAMELTRRLETEATARTMDPSYGGAFTELAKRTRRLGAGTAELAGRVL